MRVRLKGLNSVIKRLADGRTVSYFYAWKGGPALRGKPGTPEFIASYNEAVASKITPQSGTLLSILQGFQVSEDFRSLAERTRADYVKHIKVIEIEFGDFPLSAFTDRRTRGVFLAWRDRLAMSSRRQADYAWVVLARILSWALNRGLVTANPCEKGGRLYRGSRAEKIWTPDDEAAFINSAPAHLHLPLLLALWTGQRQGDLLRLSWSAYDGNHIRLRQSKTGARVSVPVGAPLKAALELHDKTWADSAHIHRQTALDSGWVPRILAQGVRKGRHCWCDLQRPSRDCRDSSSACRMHRGRDRDYHRP